MKTALSLVALVISCLMAQSVSASHRNRSDTRAILNNLDKIVSERSGYYERRKSKADSINKIIGITESDSDKLPLLLEYGGVWTAMSSDSAINIYTKGLELSRQLGDSLYAQKFLIDLSQAYFKRGQIPECLAGLQHVADEGICAGAEVKYHYVSLVVYSTIGAFFTGGEQWNDYRKKAKEHVTSILPYLVPESSVYKYCEAIGYLVDGKLPIMAARLHEVANDPDCDAYTKALANTVLGEYYMMTGENDESVKYYSVGAQSNIELSNLDEVALLRLGELLYRLGDTSRAHNYLAVSLENAVSGDMKFNLMRINDAFMDVTSALDKEKHQRVSVLTGLVVVLVVLLLLVAKMITDKRREVKHLKAVETMLARTNLAKDTFISQFMNLCSSYIESLEDYNRMSKRKITAGQTDELLTYIKSGKIIDEQRHKFYDVFDDALLRIFPDYISDVNSLLQPDKQIVTPSPKVLTTELRVLALSRLGIDDASIISRFLGISTNTIYTYRNKLRTRAINRTTFEEDAKKIGTI